MGGRGRGGVGAWSAVIRGRSRLHVLSRDFVMRKTEWLRFEC